MSRKHPEPDSDRLGLIVLILAVCVIALYGGLALIGNLRWLRPEVRTRQSYAAARQDCQEKHGFVGAEYEGCLSKARKLAWR